MSVQEFSRSERGVVVAVIGARGGAGASTVAAAVAQGAARLEVRTTLVDLDRWGGGLDVVLGIEDEPGLRWPDLSEARGAVDGVTLLARLPRWGQVAVVSAGRPGRPLVEPAIPQAAVSDVCSALQACSDLVVLDLPRSALDPADPAHALLSRCAQALLVTPLDLGGVSGALACRGALLAAVKRAALVVREPAPGKLTGREVADAVGIRLAALFPYEARLPVAVERGLGPCPEIRSGVGRAGREVAAGLVEPDWSDRDPAASRGQRGRLMRSLSSAGVGARGTR